MSDNAVKQAERFILRYRLQTWARAVLFEQQFGVCSCLRVRLSDKIQRNMGTELPNGDVGVMYKGDSASYTNLQRCDSVWVCPVCSGRITEARAKEIEQVMDLTPQYAKTFLTFTLSHHLGDDLRELLGTLMLAWRKLRQGRWWGNLREDFGWYADVRSIEVTYGANGWHPHLHVLAFHKGVAMSEAQVTSMEDRLKKKWVKILPALGFSASYERGVVVQTTDRFIAAYLAKHKIEPSAETLRVWGFPREIAKHPSKIRAADTHRFLGRVRAGRSPFQILADAFVNEADIDLFRTYALVTKGRRQLEWSRSPDLRQEVGIEIKEDDQILGEGDFVLPVEYRDFRRIAGAGQRPHLLLKAMEIADTVRKDGDVTDFYDFIWWASPYRDRRGRIQDILEKEL